jgi:presequence protease
MGEAIALMKIFNGFELLRERALTELNSTAQFYRHAKTGAELLSLINSSTTITGVTMKA